MFSPGFLLYDLKNQQKACHRYRYSGLDPRCCCELFYIKTGDIMKKQIEIAVYPDRAADRDFHKNLAAIKLNADINDITALIPLRRSIDARKAPLYRILYDVYLNETPVLAEPRIDYSPAVSDKRVIVTGFGPGGMFAALRLIEAGIRPIILERGKNVRERPFDISAILKRHIVNPDSNYCFGEGGAGTYSDGKLYTRSTKRGDVKKY